MNRVPPHVVDRRPRGSRSLASARAALACGDCPAAAGHSWRSRSGMKGGHPNGEHEPCSLAVARPEWPGASGECENGSGRHHVGTGCSKPRYVSSSLTRAGAARPQDSISGQSIRDGGVWLLRVLRSSEIWSSPGVINARPECIHLGISTMSAPLRASVKLASPGSSELANLGMDQKQVTAQVADVDTRTATPRDPTLTC